MQLFADFEGVYKSLQLFVETVTVCGILPYLKMLQFAKLVDQFACWMFAF